jgi:glycosyltransferase involved in cell wall biosynthesis
VAAVTHRKGHDVLVDALAGLRDRSWHLTCVGSLERDRVAVAGLRERIGRLGLEGRVSLAGELEEADLAEQYRRADLFVLATRFEGYGMVLAEALARGLPVVTTSAGAIPDTVPEGAGLLVSPEDAPALSGALARVMDDERLRRRLAERARSCRSLLPTWGHTVLQVHRALLEVSA